MAEEGKVNRDSREPGIMLRESQDREKMERRLDSSKVDGESNPNQLTIFFNGEICVLNDIPPEKVQAILILAAATAAMAASPSTTAPGPLTTLLAHPTARSALGVSDAAASPLLTRFPSVQSSSAAVGALSPQDSELIPNPEGSHLKLQDGLPLVRRSSLQQFFEKRRDRLTSRAPYYHLAKEGDS